MSVVSRFSFRKVGICNHLKMLIISERYVLKFYYLSFDLLIITSGVITGIIDEARSEQKGFYIFSMNFYSRSKRIKDFSFI